MICPRCKRETEGDYCSRCGLWLRPEGEAGEPEGREKGRRLKKTGQAPYGVKQTTARMPERTGLQAGDPEGQAGLEPPCPGGEDRRQPVQESGYSERQLKSSPAQTGLRDSRERTGGDSRAGESRSAGKRDGGKSAGNRRGKKRRRGSRKLPKLPGLRLPDGVLKLCSRAAQFFCAFLMLRIAWLPAAGLWEGRAGLGSVRTLAADRNYSLACYLALAGSYLFVTGILTLWILSKRHFAGEDRVISADMGRGFTAFLLLALAFWALPEAETVLAGQPMLPGAERFLEIMLAQSGDIFRAASLGAVLSLGRRILKR